MKIAEKRKSLVDRIESFSAYIRSQEELPVEKRNFHLESVRLHLEGAKKDLIALDEYAALPREVRESTIRENLEAAIRYRDSLLESSREVPRSRLFEANQKVKELLEDLSDVD